MRLIKVVIAAIVGGVLTGCSLQPEELSKPTPKLDPTSFFSGQMLATGVVQDFRGRQLRLFNADIVGSWRGNNGLLDEQFVFDDGERQERCWRLKYVDGQLLGRANDVLGTAVGQLSGNTLVWDYQLQLPAKQGGWTINLHDELFLVPPERLINRTEMTKWGLNVGEITLVIERQPERQPRANSASCQWNNSVF